MNGLTIEKFIKKCESLCSPFTDDIQEQGYAKARVSMAERVSGEFRPLRKEVDINLQAELEEIRPSWRRVFGG